MTRPRNERPQPARQVGNRSDRGLLTSSIRGNMIVVNLVVLGVGLIAEITRDEAEAFGLGLIAHAHQLDADVP